MLLVAPGISTRSKDAISSSKAFLLVARMLLGAPGLTTRSKGCY